MAIVHPSLISPVPANGGLSPTPLCLTIFCLALWCGETFLFSVLLSYWPPNSRGPCRSILSRVKTFLSISAPFSIFGCSSPSHDYWESLSTQTTSRSVSKTFHRHKKKKMHLCQITPASNVIYFLERSFCSFEFCNFTWFKKINKYSFTQRLTGPSLAATNTELAGNTAASGTETSNEEAKPTAI